MVTPRSPFVQQLVSPGGIGLAALTAGFVAAALAMIGMAGRCVMASVRWFDPLFFQYNVVLLVVAQLLVPSVTLMYVMRMRQEKERRLRRDIPDELWAAQHDEILSRLAAHFRWGNYFGSVALITTIITLGASILLLSKSLFVASAPGAAPCMNGIDYLKGANALMLGPFIDQPPGSPIFTRRLITSLTAFQFGFLGGFVYFLGHLVRSYFTLDLTPHTYVESSVRMASASLLALVISFAIPLELPCKGGDCVLHPLPMVAFFLGYFPNRALLFIEKAAAKYLGYQLESYTATPLSELQGMSLSHEVRLNREGFDNVENLAHADTVDLAVRTGLGFRQLRQWVGQAWLQSHLVGDYASFVRNTGITTRHELADVMQQLMTEAGTTTATDQILETLAGGGGGPTKAKLHAVYCLVQQFEPHRTSQEGEASGR
jgi:hypothetical protein